MKTTLAAVTFAMVMLAGTFGMVNLTSIGSLGPAPLARTSIGSLGPAPLARTIGSLGPAPLAKKGIGSLGPAPDSRR
ncbi:MAG: hypothetical protein ACRD1Y_08400 [Terriglobales bacterium]